VRSMKQSLSALTCLILWACSPAAAARPGRQTPPPPTEGPYVHQVYSASSPDGLTWTHDDVELLDHASVPCAVVTPEGAIRLYYVDASEIPETINCAESRDGGRTFTVLGLTIRNRPSEKAVDPSIVLLGDGRYRLYYYASGQNPDGPGTHSIGRAVSTDGIHFEQEGEALAYPGLVDPDVFKAGKTWLMFVFSATDRTTVVARSRNGKKFSGVAPLGLTGWGTTAPVRLDDGRYRLYAFNQNGQEYVASFVSTDGLAWTREPGTRLAAPEGKEITDPFVVRLGDGSWKMFFKVSPRRR
jgi:hypothetical protein